MTQPFSASSLYPVLPQHPWIYIHTITIIKVDTAAGTTDAEGRWIAGQSTTNNTVKAFVSPLAGERTVTSGQAREEEVHAVARVQRNTDARYTDEVMITGVSFDLDGHYRIVEARINPLDIRLMLHRVADDTSF